MNRSPYYSPMARAADMDAGGAADLQTDIMRFMAILALCLVAIFALVQSMPLEPVAIETVSTPIDETRPVQRIEPVAVPTPEPKIDPAPLTAASTMNPESFPARKLNPAPLAKIDKAAATEKTGPAPLKPPDPAPIQAQGKTPQPLAPPRPVQAIPEPAPAPAPEPPVPTPEPEGFTLRFASDTALTRLVARNEIGLYAISPDRALRMSMNRGAPSFWPASAPNQYHEMDPATVPDQVITALRRAGTLGLNPQVKWGVTLPTALRRQLDTYLSSHSGGELVIETSGTLRLER